MLQQQAGSSGFIVLASKELELANKGCVICKLRLKL